MNIIKINIINIDILNIPDSCLVFHFGNSDGHQEREKKKKKNLHPYVTPSLCHSLSLVLMLLIFVRGSLAQQTGQGFPLNPPGSPRSSSSIGNCSVLIGRKK